MTNPFEIKFDDIDKEKKALCAPSAPPSSPPSFFAPLSLREENPLQEDALNETETELVLSDEDSAKYTFRKFEGAINAAEKETPPEEKGFWTNEVKETFSVGLHGSNTEFVDKMKGLFNSTGITDIHITENKNVWIRTGGDMVKLNIFTPQGGVSSFCSDVLRIPGAFDKANCSCEHKGKRLRLRFSKSMHNNQLFVRILPGRAVPLKQIGHEKTFEFLGGQIVPGIVFVAGATGQESPDSMRE